MLLGRSDSTKPLRSRLRLLFFAPFFTPRPFRIMSQHSSLRNSGSVGTKRSVLKRGERVKLLKSRGLWKEGRLPTNLPKTKPE
jgi:small basic protein (TIGR04137 family)